MARRVTVLFALIVPSVVSQACENYGVPINSTSCACPPGFGGPTCSAPACGGDIFQGSQRAVVANSSATSFGNLTAAGCACESGWAGTGCNVCQSSGVCQSAFTVAGGTTSTSDGSSAGLGSAIGSNNTLTCNTTPQVYAAGEMSCQVINPTLQAVYPLSSTLNILRTLDTSLTPSPNQTSFGSSASVYAQLWYDGVEQFYCTASSCTQETPSEGASSWSCHNLACTCRPNATFCGGGTTVAQIDLTTVIDGLTGDLDISCGALAKENSTATCSFQQEVLGRLFGAGGLSLTGCQFGECVKQGVVDLGLVGASGNSNGGGSSLSGGVIAGLAVVGSLIAFALAGLLFGLYRQRRARQSGAGDLSGHGGYSVEWDSVSYTLQGATGKGWVDAFRRRSGVLPQDKIILDSVSGKVEPGQMMGILGPSGAGKTTLIEILAGKHKAGVTSGVVCFPSASGTSPRVGFVPQQDVLPSMLTVFEALLFAARLRLPEHISNAEKRQRVEDVVEQLGLTHVRDTRVGGPDGRGISGGEMRRVSVGLELVASPDVLILDEPTSGLDSVSASKVASVLHALAHDPENPTAVIASIHQPSSQLYQTFDRILLLTQGRALYCGAGSFAPAEHFAAHGIPMRTGYNVADHLLEIASDPSPAMIQDSSSKESIKPHASGGLEAFQDPEKGVVVEGGVETARKGCQESLRSLTYPATFLTQLEVLSGREWKILKRDKTLFFAHVAVASVLGVFCGGLYFNTGVTIAGFQSRVGCLFFLGALIAFSSLSALYNVVELRPLFVRERSGLYYSPTAWLLSRFIFDVVPLRIIPTIVVSTITYWMAGLAPHADNFFKFLFILVLYTLAMTLFNFFYGALFRNGGLAVLLSALFALYQMTFAGFFVNLSAIPPVLRWLQWICPLKYTLEALAVNEVGSGLAIRDSLEGVPVDVSAELIMKMLFGFGSGNYYRDVLVLFAFIAGFGLGVVGVVWARVREVR